MRSDQRPFPPLAIGARLHRYGAPSVFPHCLLKPHSSTRSRHGGTSLLLKYPCRAAGLPPACCLRWSFTVRPTGSIPASARQHARQPPPQRPRQRPVGRRPRPAHAASAGPSQTSRSRAISGSRTGPFAPTCWCGPAIAFDPDRLDRSVKTLYATGLFQDVRLGRAGRHAGRPRGGEPDRQPGRVRGQPQAHRRSDSARDAAAPACGVHPRAGGGRPSAHPRSVRQEAATSTRRSSRRSSAWTRTGSTSCSRSPTARPR